MQPVSIDANAATPSLGARIGTCLSLGCAVHCLLQPVLLPLLPLLPFAGLAMPVGGAMEPLLLGASFVLALWIVVRGFALHRRPGTLVLLALAAALIGAGLLVGHESPLGEAWEMGLVVSGALTLAATQLWDHRLRRRCACCRD